MSRVQNFKTQQQGSSRVEAFKQQLQQQQAQGQQAAPVQPVQPVETKGNRFMNALKSGTKQAFSNAGQALVGAGKSVVSAVDETSKLGQRGLGVIGKPLGFDTTPVSLPKTMTSPTNTMQRAGFLGGQIGMTLALPEKRITGAIDMAVKAKNLGKLAPLASAGAKAGTRAAVGAGVAKVQGASDKQAATVGGVAGGLSVVGSAFSPLLKSSAEKSYSKALGATTKENKQISDKVVPELINRKTLAVTREGLFNKAATKADRAGEALEAGYTKLPKNAQTEWKPVFENIKKAKDAVTVNGTVLDVGRYRALDAIEKDLLNVVGGGAKEAKDAVVSVETARKVRQILDKAVSQKSKIFGLTGKETDKLAVQKLAANSIREELAKEYPNIDKLNKEFSFWSNVQGVVGDTIRRTKGQTPLGLTLAEDTGAMVGAVRGGTIGNVVADAFLVRLIKQATTSTAWRTTSAVTKHQLSNFLATGDVAKATALLQRIIGKKQDITGSQPAKK
jgi:hypothetical protein